jgi:phospholipid-binding lipoprotein MlaA
MVATSYAGALVGGLCALSLCGCVTLPPNSQRSPQDPWESWNRGVYKVNDKLDRAVAKPVTRAYMKVVPRPLRTGVSNFFANLNTPTVLINDALQGKFRAAGSDLGRLILNTTIGLGGLLDPATSAGLDRNDEDFGQTLGKWGVHAGPFLEIPVLGPSDARDAPARVVDTFTNPQAYIGSVVIKYPLYGLYLIDTRQSLMSLDDTLKHVYDPYAFIRDAYLQRRAYLVSDGKSNDEPLVDPDTSEPDAERTPNAPVHEGSTPPPGTPAPPPESPPTR